MRFKAQIMKQTSTTFGSAMNTRSYSSGAYTDSYRYGFNGKELDKDEEGMSGGGSTYDYGFRIYNPNLAKFLSVDPLRYDYPWFGPYHFANNTPVWANDLDGLEPNYNPSTGKGTLKDYEPILTPTDIATLLKNTQFHDNHFVALEKFFTENMSAIKQTGTYINLLQKQFGGYDCITTMIAANMILFNSTKDRKFFNSSLNNGNVVTYNKRLVAAGYAIHNQSTDFYEFNQCNKKPGDIATQADFTLKVGLGAKLDAKINSKNAGDISMFNLALGVDYHSMMIIARNEVVPDIDPVTGVQKTNANGNLMTKVETIYYKADEINTGWKKIGNSQELDKYIESWHFQNTTKNDSNGNRVITDEPKGQKTSQNKGTFYQLKRK